MKWDANGRREDGHELTYSDYINVPDLLRTQRLPTEVPRRTNRATNGRSGRASRTLPERSVRGTLATAGRRNGRTKSCSSFSRIKPSSFGSDRFCTTSTT